MPTHRTEYLLTAKDKTGRAFKSAESGMKKVGKAAAGITLALAAAAGAMVALVKNQADATRSTRNYADALGVSVEQMSRYEYAFSTVGIESEKTGDILKDVAEKIGDAYRNNAGEAKEALESLGISIAAINQLAPDQQLLVIADALEEVGTQGEKVQILEALANDASKLIPLLDDNARGLKELGEEADKTGRTLTVMEAEALQKADLALKKLDGSFIGLKQTLAVELAGPTAYIIEWMQRKIPVAVSTATIYLDNLTAGWIALKGVFTGDEMSFGDRLAKELTVMQQTRDSLMSPPGREGGGESPGPTASEMLAQQHNIAIRNDLAARTTSHFDYGYSCRRASYFPGEIMARAN